MGSQVFITVITVCLFAAFSSGFPIFVSANTLRVIESDIKNNNGMKCWSVSHEMSAGLIFSVIAIGKKKKHISSILQYYALFSLAGSFPCGDFDMALEWAQSFSAKTTHPHTHRVSSYIVLSEWR